MCCCSHNLKHLITFFCNILYIHAMIVLNKDETAIIYVSFFSNKNILIFEHMYLSSQYECVRFTRKTSRHISIYTCKYYIGRVININWDHIHIWYTK